MRDFKSEISDLKSQISDLSIDIEERIRIQQYAAERRQPVGPDGRVSYLEAQDLPAAGRTIDELRAAVDKELEKFRRAPRSMITPAAFNSKKYFMLGGVTERGVFTLERPITIIEAVAKARGLETGVSDRTTVELVDLSRSFLARQGKRMEINFEKLFQAGDLSQNIALEPNDYLYFPVANLKELYVLGEVQFPGPVPYNPGISTVSAISVRGGFTDRAWKKKLLVVRGSLNPCPTKLGRHAARWGCPSLQSRPQSRWEWISCIHLTCQVGSTGTTGFPPPRWWSG